MLPNFPDLMIAMNRKGASSNATSDTNNLKVMRVNELRKMLHEKRLDVDGSREMMIARLEEASENHLDPSFVKEIVPGFVNQV